MNVALVGKLVPVSCHTHRERGVGGEAGAGELTDVARLALDEVRLLVQQRVSAALAGDDELDDRVLHHDHRACRTPTPLHVLQHHHTSPCSAYHSLCCRCCNCFDVVCVIED